MEATLFCSKLLHKRNFGLLGLIKIGRMINVLWIQDYCTGFCSKKQKYRWPFEFQKQRREASLVCLVFYCKLGNHCLCDRCFSTLTWHWSWSHIWSIVFSILKCKIRMILFMNTKIKLVLQLSIFGKGVKMVKYLSNYGNFLNIFLSCCPVQNVRISIIFRGWNELVVSYNFGYSEKLLLIIKFLYASKCYHLMGHFSAYGPVLHLRVFGFGQAAHCFRTFGVL